MNDPILSPACEEFLRSLDGEGEAANHLRVCDACREYNAMLEELAEVRDLIAIPAGELRGMRHRVLATAPKRRPWLAIAAMFAAQAFVMLAAGYVLGRRAERPHSIAASLSATKSSPYILSDVRLLDTEGEFVELTAIAGEEVHLRLRRDHPLVVREVVQAWLRGGSTNQRLEAARLADPRGAAVRGALLSAIRNDPNDAVQLAAFNRVASLPPDDALVEALLAILSSPEDTALKLRAVDYLVNHRVEPGRLRDALTAADRPVLVRASAYLAAQN